MGWIQKPFFWTWSKTLGDYLSLETFKFGFGTISAFVQPFVGNICGLGLAPPPPTWTKSRSIFVEPSPIDVVLQVATHDRLETHQSHFLTLAYSSTFSTRSSSSLSFFEHQQRGCLSPRLATYHSHFLFPVLSSSWPNSPILTITNITIVIVILNKMSKWGVLVPPLGALPTHLLIPQHTGH